MALVPPLKPGKVADLDAFNTQVLAKELENQEIILHIDKLHTAQKRIEPVQRANAAAYGTGDSENAGELREQLKEARQKTTKLEEVQAQILSEFDALCADLATPEKISWYTKTPLFDGCVSRCSSVRRAPAADAGCPCAG